jgi:hypothetical protein
MEPVDVRAARIPTFAGFRTDPSQAVPLPDGPAPAFSQRLDPSTGSDLLILLPAAIEGEAWLVDVAPAPRIYLPSVEARERRPGEPDLGLPRPS